MATKTIAFPDTFPDSITLKNNIQDTVTYSWALQNFTEYNISAWLNNFQGEVFPKEDEERIALWLLSNYTHYNEKEVDHLCKTLYKKFIHTYVIDQGLTEKTLLESMKNFCYIPLGSASESGGFIAYQFRKQARIGIDRFFFPTENAIINGNVAIFIDDVTLSATQAKKPITDFAKNHSFGSVYLLTLISSSNAEKELIPCIYSVPYDYEYFAGDFSYKSSLGDLQNYELAGYGGEYNPDDPNSAYVVFLGFEGALSLKVLEEATYKRLIFVNSLPSLSQKYKDISILNNRSSIKGKKYDSILYAPADNPFEVYNFLEKEYADEASVCISPLATKPVALGVCLFALNYEKVRIVYPISDVYSSHVTNRVIKTLVYEISLIQ